MSSTSRGVHVDCTEIVTASKMASLERARTRSVSGEVEYYHKETDTWNTEKELREKERQRRTKREKEEEGELESVKNGRKKERLFVKEEWKRCKQIELYRFEYLC